MEQSHKKEPLFRTMTLKEHHIKWFI